MNLSRWPIQAYGDTAHSDILHAGERLARDQSRGRRRKRGAKAFLDRVSEDIVEVAAHHRIAAGDHQDRIAELADLIDQAARLGGGEFVRVALGLCLSPAMATSERAGAGDLPGDGERGQVKVRLDEASVEGSSLRHGPL